MSLPVETLLSLPGAHPYLSLPHQLAGVLNRFVGRGLQPLLVSPKLEDLVVLKELIEAGKVTPVFDRAYPLGETPEAVGHVGGEHARGKVAVTV